MLLGCVLLKILKIILVHILELAIEADWEPQDGVVHKGNVLMEVCPVEIIGERAIVILNRLDSLHCVHSQTQ